MATTAPPDRDHLRDAVGFGGMVPTGAVARSGETLVAVLGIEHHADGAVIPLLVLSEAPGLVEWEPAMGLSIRDDRGDRYDGHTVTSASGLGQLSVTLWVAPSLPADARRLELVIDGLARLNPTRGGGRGVARPLAGGPWSLIVNLLPERTVADLPPPPGADAGGGHTGSVPVRAHAMFVDVVPAGQARLGEGIVVCLLAVERYWDRGVATLVALGRPGGDVDAPAIGRAAIRVWDDLGHTYDVTPIQGAAREEWSEVAVEIVPAIPPDARVLAVQVSDVPCGPDTRRSSRIAGPFTFGVKLPAR